MARGAPPLPRPIRRIVTGTDARGRSIVLKDGPAPNDHKNLGISRYFTDLWVWNESPAPITGNADDGDCAYDFPCPPDGGHLRIVEWHVATKRTSVRHIV